MRIAIISDIHSNLEALQKSISIIEENKVDKIICLGDVVGYGANPKECLKIIHEISSFILLGNHDQAAADVRYTESFTVYANVAARWTNKILTESEKELLLSFPLSIESDGITYVHASPYRPSEWDYISNYEDAFFNFSYFNNNICFVGHSHIPEIFMEDYNEYQLVRNSVKLKCMPDKKYIINVGSVGQPRDRDWRLSFGIFDDKTYEYENIRSEYDVQSAAKKIVDAGFPHYLANRILVGR